jgi:hypothetical protein
MNRRTFLKSAFVFVLGLLGFKIPILSNAYPSGRISGDASVINTRVAGYEGMPQVPQIEFKPHHIWWTTTKGQILVCTFDRPDEPVWKVVSKVGDV